MSRRTSVVFFVGVLAVSAASVRAEDNAPYRTAVSAVGGLSVGSSGGPGRLVGDLAQRFGLRRDGSSASFAVGGGVARDVTPRFTVEANAMYINQQSGSWSADAGMRLNLLPATRSMVPYFAVSGGVLGGSTRRLDLDGIERMGQDVRGFLQTQLQTDHSHGFAELLPKVTTAMEDAKKYASGGSYADAMMTMGGGVRIDAGPHVFVRPDARAQLVFSDGTKVRGLFTLNFGYRF